MDNKKIYQAALVSKAIVARDVLEFRLTKPAAFSFLAGQFIQFHIPREEHAQGYVLRSYSVACAPTNDYLDFFLKLLPAGKASAFFCDLSPGGEVALEGPQGRFICEPSHAPRKIFIATGTGLAPIRAMLEDEISNAAPQRELSLLFGVHAEPDLFGIQKLDELARTSKYFSYKVTLSHPDNPAQWSGLTGRVTEHLPSTALPAEYYVCGNLEMIKDVRLALVGQGVKPASIHFEIF